MCGVTWAEAFTFSEADFLTLQIVSTSWDCVCPAPCAVVITVTPPCRAHHVCMECARQGQSGERGPGVMELRPLSTSMCPETPLRLPVPSLTSKELREEEEDVEQKGTE